MVLTYGTFDLLHYGHINILKRARQLGSGLIVGLSTELFNETKGKNSLFTYEQRKFMLESCVYVDKIIPENSWEQKVLDIKKYDVDTFVMGSDWLGKFDYLNQYCKVVYLDRTPDVSTTKIKNMVFRDFQP